MDPTRFDALTRVMSQVSRPSPSRRAMLAAIGALLASAVGSSHEADAKRRRKKVRGRVRHRKHRGKHKTPPCPTGQQRCDTGCAGCCTDSDCGGNACLDGRCSDCPRDQRLCRGGCLAKAACCTDDECTGRRTCIDGTCACRGNERECQGACIPKDDCCGTDCPPPPPPPPPTCSPDDCGGCCDGGTCRQGDSQNFCGRDGVDCVTCAAGETCDGGLCKTPSQICNPETCPLGCCDGTKCKDGDSENFCGRGGVACEQCEAAVTCIAGHCGCQTECCANSDCDTHPGGLCRPGGTCVYPPTCLPTGANCISIASCCSHFCSPGGPTPGNECGVGDPGRPCIEDADCLSGDCEFYVCAA